MKTKNIFKTLVLATVLVSACNKSEIANDENAENKGFALPVTVNVTREGDDATKATYNESTRKLEFTAGDKLLVHGNDNSDGGAGMFAGMLDYDASEGKFSGTIYTKNSYSGTADELFTAANSNWVGATLFPNGYESYEFLSLSGSGYSTSYSMSYNKAIAATKVAAIEQFSLESAKTYSSGFALSPENAIFNFTITGLTDGEKAVTLKDGTRTMFTGSVTPTSGTAAFALGARIKDSYDFSVNLKNVTLTIGGTDIDITDANKNLEAGKIYNITRNAIPGALIGQFSVSDTKQVYFSQGNLQYQASPSPTWRFAEHQYDYVGDASKGNVYVESVKSNNASISSSYTGWIDLFGWGTGDNPTKTSTNYNEYGSFTDWGSNAISNGGNEAGTWRTLTGGSGGEWEYLFKTRTTVTTNMPTGNNNGSARYTKATVAGVSGVILFPDNYAHPAGVTVTVSDAAYNTDTKNYTTFTVDASNWVTMQSAGCVFLPAAGFRYNGSTVSAAGSGGHYWSSSPYTSDVAYAHYVSISSDGVNPANKNNRERGRSVRLVREVQP